MVAMWVAAIAIAARGACFINYNEKECPTNDNLIRCMPRFSASHEEDASVPKCPAAKTKIVAVSSGETPLELFQNFIDQQGTMLLAKPDEHDCKDTGSCRCFEDHDLARLIDTSVVEKSKITYQTVAAASSLISTTDASVIDAAAIEEVRVVGAVANKSNVPVGAYAFACRSDPARFFVLRENRLLAQAKGETATTDYFKMGLFRDVALSSIANCDCNGEEVVELVVRPETHKGAEDTIPEDVWFDASVCRHDFKSCLIEEMERPCSECLPGQAESKACGLFYDTVCSGTVHRDQAPVEKADVDQTAAIILLCLLIGIALIVFMSASVQHTFKEEEKTALQSKPLKTKMRIF